VLDVVEGGCPNLRFRDVTCDESFLFKKERTQKGMCNQTGFASCCIYTIVKKEYGHGSFSDGGRRTVHQQLSQSPRSALIQELMMMKPILALSKKLLIIT
jgi:hypothetical protein